MKDMREKLERVGWRIWIRLQDQRGLTTVEYIIGASIILIVLAGAVMAWNNGFGREDQPARPAADGNAVSGRGLWRRLRDSRGQATVEAVLVVPLVLVPVLFGVVTFGQLEHTRLVLDSAAAAGARQAAVDGQDDQAVRDRIDLELQDGGINPTTVTVSVSPAVADWGQPIQVRLSITSHASIPFLGGWDVPMSSDFTTRSEVTH